MKAEAPTPRVVDRNRTQSIYLKAAEIFHRKGFDATSMDDIARALQITKAGLYYYIKGKEDLLFAIMTYAMDWLSSEVVEPARTVADPEQRLRLIIERHGRELMEGPRSLAILSDEVARASPKHRRQILKRSREVRRPDPRHTGRSEGPWPAGRCRHHRHRVQHPRRAHVVAPLVL